MRKSVLVAAAMTALAIGATAVYFTLTSPAPPESTAHPEANARRPEFRLPDLDGTHHAIGEWEGKVVLVNFWAPWCPPCRREIPALVALQEKYGERGLVVLGITVDTADNARDFVDTSEINYPILIAEEQGIELAQRFGNRLGALPYTAFVDRSGQIHGTHRSEITYEEAENTVLPLL